jgi:DNA-binding transcriptional regulator LsrR (DeoR family)
MSLAELVITSVTVEGRTKSEVARDYRVSRYWVHQLVQRYQAEGEAAFQPRCARSAEIVWLRAISSPTAWCLGSSLSKQNPSPW